MSTRAENVLSEIRELHKPCSIFELCDHEHQGDEPGVLDTGEFGLTCRDKHVVDICASCCVNNDGNTEYQSEECASAHDHNPGKALCPTREILDKYGADLNEFISKPTADTSMPPVESKKEIDS